MSVLEICLFFVKLDIFVSGDSSSYWCLMTSELLVPCPLCITRRLCSGFVSFIRRTHPLYLSIYLSISLSLSLSLVSSSWKDCKYFMVFFWGTSVFFTDVRFRLLLTLSVSYGHNLILVFNCIVAAFQKWRIRDLKNTDIPGPARFCQSSGFCLAKQQL